MLEYTTGRTVRRQDQPLLQRSQRKLRWVITGESHSYVSSSTAKVGLPIRRIILAFGSAPSRIRFVATTMAKARCPNKLSSSG